MNIIVSYVFTFLCGCIFTILGIIYLASKGTK